eukprot:TRINITY_DN5118_c0_g1_i1.p1 TRINITY_DN5118_c0_g1~~TRINITY_DN5118_c0_g1_i1.p1  ORF type:complete len:165 (-),score=23.38 TRINITY_DN5118_c0_g1_i1:66-560(-)
MSDRQTRVVNEAKNKIGSSEWAITTTKANFGQGEPKCNLFVADMLATAGFQVPMHDRSPSRRLILVDFVGYMRGDYDGQRPPTCNEWYEGSVPGTQLVGQGVDGCQRCWPGDIITDGSHIGIVSGVRKVISASSRVEDHLKIVENDWGWRQGEVSRVKIFRYHP